MPVETHVAEIIELFDRGAVKEGKNGKLTSPSRGPLSRPSAHQGSSSRDS